jgi:hypothetical protein
MTFLFLRDRARGAVFTEALPASPRITRLPDDDSAVRDGVLRELI